jgi:hypothetical protein
MTNRYQELLARLPRGSFYGAVGHVLPYRGPNPYEFLFSPVTASRVYGIYVNDQFRGTTTADASGQAVVRVILGQGRQDIVLVDTVTQAHFPAYVDIRVSATVLAAHAEVLESIDEKLDDIQASLSLETASSRYLEDVYGRPLRQANDLGDWLLDSYRQALRWLRPAYRAHGSKLKGLRQAVFAFTSSLPLRVPQAWRPAMSPGGSLAPDAEMSLMTRTTASPLTNNNARAFTYVHAAYNGVATPFPGPFTNPPGARASATVSAPDADGIQTLTDSTADFDVDVSGSIRLTAATNPENIGEFALVDWLGPTKLRFTNPGGVAEVGTVSYVVEAMADTLVVRLVGAWDGGPITVTGTSPDGDVQSETFTPTAPPEDIYGLLPFSTVTSAAAAVIAGAGTASIGLGTRRFLRLDAIGAFNAPGVAVALAYSQSPDRLRWGTGTLIPIPASGSYTLHDVPHAGVFFSLTLQNFTVGTDERFLTLEADDKGQVLIDTADAHFSGGGGARTAAQIATSINTYFGRDTRYGAVRAVGTVTVPSGLAIDPTGGSTVSLNDGVSPSDTAPTALLFEFRTGTPATAGRVLVRFAPGDTATVVAEKLAAAINNGANDDPPTAAPFSAGAIRLTATSSGAVVTIVNDFGGAQGNQTITLSAQAIADGFTKTDLAGGTQSPSYTTVAAAVTATNAAFGVTVRLKSPTTGTSSNVRLHPGGADALRVVFGEPRYAATLNGNHTLANDAQTVAINLDASPQRLPQVAELVVLHSGFLDTAAPAAIAQPTPTHPTSLEVYFDPAYRATGVRIQGTAHGTGAAQFEDFLRPNSTVASGAAASSANGSTITLSSESFAGAQAGMYFRRTDTGEGEYIRYVISATEIRLRGTVSGFPWGPVAWAVTRETTAEGTLAFATLEQIQNLSTPGAGTAGRATLTVIDPELHGYLVRIGRGNRLETNAAADRILTPTGSGSTATYQDTATPLVTRYADLGGYLLIRGSTVGSNTNNGLHKVIAFTDLVGGFTVTLRHQDADRGGLFFLESPLPATTIVRHYSTGEIVRVVHNEANILTLLPPGLAENRIDNDLVELADELPWTAAGWDGLGTVDVTVDRNLLPTGATSDNITSQGALPPDGWRALNQVGLVPTFDPETGFYKPWRLVLQGSGVDDDTPGMTDQALEFELSQATVEAYRGFFIRATFWVQQHIAAAAENFRVVFSTDGGVTFSTGTNDPVTGTFYNASAGNGAALDPTAVADELKIPYNARSLIIRLRHMGTDVPGLQQLVGVERVEVVAKLASDLLTGTELGEGSVAYTTHQAKFGELLYVWAPGTALNSDERRALGLAQAGVVPLSYPAADAPGQIDYVTNAHGYWERFPMNAPATGTPTNVLGAYTDAEWLTAQLTNLELVVGTPPRTTVVRPSAISLATETLTVVAPSNAVLLEAAAHEGVLLGTGGSFSFAAGTITFTDLKANFPTAVTGQTIEIRGAYSVVNDGDFTATRTSSTTLTWANANGRTESYPSTAVYRIRTVFPEESFTDERLLEVTTTFPDGLPVPATAQVAGGVLPWRFLDQTFVGTGDSFTFAAGTVTFADAEANFPASVVGRRIKVVNPTSAGNAGTFTIASRPSATSLTWANAAGVTEAFTGTYVILPTVQIASVAAGDPAAEAVYNSAATYRLTYRRLMRAETAVIDLGASFAQSLWYVDLAIYRRGEAQGRPFTTTVQLNFLADLRATLQTSSDEDLTTSVFVQDTGLVQTEIPRANYRYIDARTVEIDSGVFDEDALYSLTYTALEADYPSPVAYVLEHRSSNVSTAAVLAATWRLTTLDALAPYTDRYHQLRVTLSGVTDVRDVQIAGLGLRGFAAYASPPVAPGLVIP